MITGEYIVEFVGINHQNLEVAKGNSVISNTELVDAYDFYNTVMSNIIHDYPQLSQIRIVGVFKL